MRPFTPRNTSGMLMDIYRALIAGSWLNSMLLSLEVKQAWRYFSRYPNDSKILRATVALCNFINAISTVGQYAAVYMVRDRSVAALLVRKSLTRSLISCSTPSNIGVSL